jgi:hypothetical protein
MAKNKKKNRTLLFLSFAMILTLVAYAVVIKINDGKEADASSEEDTSITLLDLKENSVNSIEYTNESGQMKLTKQDDTWVNENDKNFPVNQSYVESMVTSVSTLTSDRLVSKEVDDLSEFGLDKPLIQIIVSADDGTSTTIKVGSKLVTGDAYYLMLNDENAVYTVDTTLYKNFAYTNNQMVSMETPPSITADYITKISIDNKEKDDFEIIYDEDSDNNTSDYYLWSISKPYSVNVAADTDKLNDYFTNFASLSFKECAEYNTENLKKYGLETPASKVLIKYYEVSTTASADTSSSDSTEAADSNASSNDSSTQVRTDHEYILYIGDKNDDGDYYVRPEESQSIYIMSADSVEAMTNVSPFDYIASNVNLTSIDTVDKMEITAGDTNYILSIKRSKTTDDDGNETQKSTYYCNDKEVSEDDFKTVYQNFLSLTNEAEITKENKDNTSKVSIKIQKNTKENNEITINFKPYDSSYYRVDNNGTEFFLTTKRAVDDFVTAVKGLSEK